MTLAGELEHRRHLPESPVSWLIGAAVVLWAFLDGAAPLSDNSFLTHLATGRRILSDGVPNTDPYLIAEPGLAWTVQSWLASWFYAAVESVGGAATLRLLAGATAGAIVAIAWWLSGATPTLLSRVVLMAAAMAALTGFLVPRPLLFGLLAMAVLLALHRGQCWPALLAVVAALWVNTHGSWTVGLVLLAALTLGAACDRVPFAWHRAAMAWFVLGLVVGALLSPPGAGLLTFPVELLDRREVLSQISEWQGLGFEAGWEFATWLLAGVGILAVVRSRRWEVGLPVVMAAALAVSAQRNAAVLALVVVAVGSSHLPGIGSLRGTDRSVLVTVLTGAVVAAGLVASVGIARAEPFALGEYPVELVDVLDEARILGAVVVLHPDPIGNYLAFALDADQQPAVFVDDRVEVLPGDLVEDYRTAAGAGPGWQDVLDRRDVQVVVWPAGSVLARALDEDPEWSVQDQRDGWVLACRTGGDAAWVCGLAGPPG